MDPGKLMQGAKEMLTAKLKQGEKLLKGEDQHGPYKQNESDNPAEKPGVEAATLTMADNAGVETQGAVADESTAAQDRGVANKGAAPEHGDPTVASHPLVVGGAVGSGSMGSAPGDPREGEQGGVQDMQSQHEAILEDQHRHGKIFTQEPVIEGAGGVVHGVMPAAILMHTAQHVKRTGGSPKDAIEGVPDPDEAMAPAAAGGVSPAVLPSEVEAPGVDTEGARQP